LQVFRVGRQQPVAVDVMRVGNRHGFFAAR
jgi:hypothetical protein